MLDLIKYGSIYPMSFKIANYINNGNLYVGLITHKEGYPESWQDLTVNLDIKCALNKAYIDTNNNGNDIIEWLEQNGLGYRTGNYMSSGFCEYPEFEFDMEILLKHTTVDYRK